MFLIDPNDDAAADRAARHQSICQEMLELGMRALRKTAESMQAPPETPLQGAPRPPDRVAQFEKLSHCIRQIILLENHVADARRNIVTKTIQLEKDRAFAAAFNASFNSGDESPPQPERLSREHTPMPATEAEIPSILTNISREIGIDLTDRTLLASLPKPRPQTGPREEGEPAPD